MTDIEQLDAVGADDPGKQPRDGSPAVGATSASTKRRKLSRRQFIPRALGLVAAVGAGGAGGYELRGTGDARAFESRGEIPPAGSLGAGVGSFVTRPDLRPALARLSYPVPDDGQISPRFILLTPMPEVPYPGVQRGPMLLDRRGHLVWYQPAPDSVFDLQRQEYRGRPVLSWWHGTVTGGYGEGVGELVDDTYAPIATIGDARKRPLDLHELNLTSRGTALATYYERRPYDLSSIGGSANGYVLVGHALEIEIATNRVLFDWSSLDHVGLNESFAPTPSSASQAYDFVHINSIAEMDDGHLLISGRNTWCLYKVSRRTGEIIWRLGGKRSDFAVARSAWFSWQHHARPHGSSEITLFDNANTSGHGSLALVLTVDDALKRVELKRAYQHPAKFLADSLGSVQLLRDGRVFVGWGAMPYFSEFSPAGEISLDGQFLGTSRSYRAFLVDWVGRPRDKPRVVARTNPSGGFVVYASWNGATEIDHWTVLAGSSAATLKAVGSQRWSGLETAIIVNSEGPAFAVAAIDRDGNELRRSDVV